MNESYRRSLTTALQLIERDLVILQRACHAPADGVSYRERLDGDPGAMLRALERTLRAVREAARALSIPSRTISLPWYARAQSLSHLVILDDLDPERVGMSYGRLGEPDEIRGVAAILVAVSRSLSELSDSCETVAQADDVASTRDAR